MVIRNAGDRGNFGEEVYRRFGWAGLALALLFALPVHSADTLSTEKIRKSYFDSYQLETRERYLESITALAPVMKAYANTYTVNYRTGWLYFKNKSWSDALKYYTTALAICPSSLEAHIGMINVQSARQDWKAVEEQCKRALQLDYNNSTVNLWLIISEVVLGNPTAAKKNVYRMLAFYPTSTAFLEQLGKIQYGESDFTAASQTFNAIQILDPFNQSAVTYLNLLKTSKP